MKGYPSTVVEKIFVGHLGMFASSFVAGPYCQERRMSSAGVRGDLRAGGGGVQLGAKLSDWYATLLKDVSGLKIGTIVQ